MCIIKKELRLEKQTWHDHKKTAAQNTSFWLKFVLKEK